MRYLLVIILFFSFSLQSQNLPQSLWKVKYESSYQTEHSAIRIIDGDTTTYWHSAINPQKAIPPHEIQIDLGAKASFNAVVLSPRKNNTAGRCAKCDISISDNGENWQLLKTTFLFWNKNNDFSDKTIYFDTPVTARYIRYRHLLTFDNGMSDASVGTLSEITVKGEYVSPVVAANFSMEGNPPYLSVNQKIFVKNTSTAYLSDIQSLKWHCPGAELSVDKDGNATLVYRKCGSYSFSLTATNNKGFTSHKTLHKAITILPGPYINRRNWIVKEFSEECPAYEAFARHTIDSIPKTRWVTSWDQLKTLPHYIVYDMGAKYNVQGFGYLPSQYKNDEGAATEWSIYISGDAKNWGKPVGQGSWTYHNTDIKYEQLKNTTGRYVKFQINKSLPAGQNYANCSEFYVYGTAAKPNYPAYIWGIIAVLCFAFALWYLKSRKSGKKTANQKTSNTANTRKEHPDTQIFLFGEFRITHKGNDISASLYPKLKHLFALMLFHKNGISIHTLTDLLWPGMPADKASSNRGTNIQNLKKALSDIEGIQFSYAVKEWKVNTDSSVYCDYYEYRKLTQKLLQHADAASIDAMCGILERGTFLKNLEADCFDEIKEKITEEVTNLLASIALNKKQEISRDLKVRIADCILLFDELSETGLEIKIKSLLEQNKQSIARLCFDNFCKRHKLIYNLEYTRKFNSFR